METIEDDMYSRWKNNTEKNNMELKKLRLDIT